MDTGSIKRGARRPMHDDCGTVRPGFAAYLAMVALLITGTAALYVTIAH